MSDYGAIKGHSNRIRIGLSAATNSSIWAGRDPLINTLSFDTSVDTEKIYVIGSRDAVDITEGVQEISGSIERNLYSKNATYNEVIYENDTAYHDFLSATGMYGDNLSACKILLNTTSRESSDNFNRVIYGTKFHSYSTDHGATDLITESMEYDSTNVSTS